MALTRLQMQTAIYEILQKEATAYGLLTPTKVNNTIQDSLDWIAATMLTANSMWQQKIVLLNMVANTPAVAIPTDCAIINFVKKMSATDNTTYVELEYKETNKETINTTPIENGQSNTQSYMIINNALYLEPTPLNNLVGGIRLSYLAYPADLAGDATTIDGDLSGKPFLQLCKWRSALTLYQMSNEGTPPWSERYDEWYTICLKLIGKRAAMPVVIPGVQNY